ncbi:transcription factor TGAL5-like isoform X1 [Panicum hallii]|uniref:transcription factor TGAL5-like isoform X1 n=1 Tax=Panicum hallii TaxID=206008 RepID=UPI000DF4DE4D|nr:transcription factor TGAL5-like isoform X1 [Panicum hallii]
MYAAAGNLAARPLTLEIFPSWPMSHLQQPYSQGNSHSVGSTTDSSSGQNTMPQAELVSPGSMRADSGQQQEVLMVTVDDYNYEQGLGSAATTAPIFQQHTACQDKRKNGSTGKDGKLLDAKTERRLAQNREAARKSRLRKKAYVQQLETSRIRLQQVEHELQGARSQGLFPGGGSASGDSSSGAVMFDMEYARWLEDDSNLMMELQGIMQAQNLDANLDAIVEECVRHYDELFHLRAMLARSDVFHLMTGLWATTAERCFLWMGGFRPSEILKMLIPQLDPLTEQQLLGMCNLQRSSEQTEEALVQGLQQLHQSLADAVGASPLSDGASIGNYTALMALALDRLDTLESFYRQLLDASFLEELISGKVQQKQGSFHQSRKTTNADNLRQQTLQHMRRLLTTRQAARCFLSIGEYRRRLRALSSVWASSRPRESFVAAAENVSPTATGTAEQAVHPYSNHSQFSGF